MLRKETSAWANSSNEKQRGVDWKFTTKDARHKLKSLYPAIKDCQNTRKLNPETQQELRRIAIRLKKSGKTYTEISEIIQVHKSTICAWYKKYEREAIRLSK